MEREDSTHALTECSLLTKNCNGKNRINILKPERDLGELPGKMLLMRTKEPRGLRGVPQPVTQLKHKTTAQAKIQGKLNRS